MSEERVYLVIPREPSGRSERMQVFPGLLGDIMSVNGRGETVVQVNKQDGLRALDRMERRYRADVEKYGETDTEFAKNLALIESKRELFR